MFRRCICQLIPRERVRRVGRRSQLRRLQTSCCHCFGITYCSSICLKKVRSRKKRMNKCAKGREIHDGMRCYISYSLWLPLMNKLMLNRRTLGHYVLVDYARPDYKNSSHRPCADVGKTENMFLYRSQMLVLCHGHDNLAY